MKLGTKQGEPRREYTSLRVKSNQVKKISGHRGCGNYHRGCVACVYRTIREEKEREKIDATAGAVRPTAGAARVCRTAEVDRSGTTLHTRSVPDGKACVSDGTGDAAG